jgi:hypothetical protein
MTWESFYLTCFLVGFLLSLVSFLGQALHFGGGDHPGGGDLHGPDLHGDAAAAHGGDLSAPDVPDAQAAHAHASSVTTAEPEISKLNFMTVTAFLAWFGGTGYLLARYAGLWVWFGFGVATVVGLAGASAVFWILGKLVAREYNLNPADYDMMGVLGHVSSPVRQGGIGEMVFSQEGVRKAAPIRSEEGRPIEKGVEVVVTRFEKGVAYVRRWDELSGESAHAASQ